MLYNFKYLFYKIPLCFYRKAGWTQAHTLKRSSEVAALGLVRFFGEWDEGGGGLFLCNPTFLWEMLWDSFKCLVSSIHCFGANIVHLYANPSQARINISNSLAATYHYSLTPHLFFLHTIFNAAPAGLLFCYDFLD